MAMEYIEDLLAEKSKEVLRGCALSIGAIVAADINHPAYPDTAENYYYNWVRDAAFQVVAAKKSGMAEASDMRRANLMWLEEKHLEYKATGLPIKRTSPNGAPDRRYGTEYQPDQTGAYLWALHQTAEDPDRQTDRVMRRLANSLVNSWAGSHFDRKIQDLWENTAAYPEQDENFTYSIVVCICGLQAAIDRLAHQGIEGERSVWLEAKNQMLGVLVSDQNANFGKKISSPGDSNGLDASSLCLMYPLEPAPSSEFGQKAASTISAVEQELYRAPDGMLRYLGDTYDGIVRPDGSETTAGRWPLLTFWLAIAKNRMGERKQALDIYRQHVGRLGQLFDEGLLPRGYIPEQIYPDDERQGKGVVPLGWSHAMFLIALAELNP